MPVLCDDHPREECGVIGIYAPNEDVARMAFFGLYALQHRGQEAAGIAVSDGQTVRMHKDVGLVSQVFNENNLAPLHGHYAIGHTRYSTTGSPIARNAQPFLIDTRYGPLAVAHNGNLTNAASLRAELLENGVGLSSSSDTEVIAMLLAGVRGETWDERIHLVMQKMKGAFSLVILTCDCVYAVRDPWGFHPLSVGMLPSGGHVAASETGALRTIGCIAIREVRPGEVITLSNTALSVYQAMPPVEPQATCVFEYVYFARPDCKLEGLNVHQVRQQFGRELAHMAPVEADIVIPVPDSSIPAAIGYSAESGIPYNDGFIKNRYIGRTFIQPTATLRRQGVALKANVIEENVRGKRVVMIDDSIVRGNTTGPLLKLLHDAGAKEVHVRITCPPIRHPCYMGVDMGNHEDLIAYKKSVQQICDHIGADSLAFLSLEGMLKPLKKTAGVCHACFTGEYPIQIDDNQVKLGFEKSIA